MATATRTTKTSTLLTVACVALASCAGAEHTARESSPRDTRPPPVEDALVFRRYSPDVFEQARREHKLVLLDVGIEGCTACRWMAEDTYRNPEVVSLVSSHFITVAVDANLRPDLGARYERWGWPATIVLRPNGEQVLALRGNRRSSNFLGILRALLAAEAAGLGIDPEGDPVAAEAAGSEESVAAAEGGLTALQARCRQALSGMDDAADRESGGFGRAMRHANAGPLRLQLARARMRNEAWRTEHARRSLAGLARMIDPVWGGAFVAARQPDHTQPIPEKRTVQQGPLLAAFAEAYHESGEARWLDAALAIERYLAGPMLAPDGTWYASQEDEAPGLPASMTASDYYGLPDAQRRRFGLPPVDHVVYSDINANVIEGYVRLFEATRDPRHLATARRAAAALLETRQDPSGLVHQARANDAAASDARMRSLTPSGALFLAPQGPLGLALLALHSATGEARWLLAARRIAAGLETLRDSDRAAYRASDAPLGPLRPTVDFDANVTAARFLLRLAWATHDETLEQHVAAVARVLSGSPEAERGGVRAYELVLLAQELSAGPLVLSIVGAPDNPRAQALFEAARHVWEPRKVVQYSVPGERYPDDGHPTAYVCGRDACSSPLTTAAELQRAVVLQAVPMDGGC